MKLFLILITFCAIQTVVNSENVGVHIVVNYLKDKENTIVDLGKRIGALENTMMQITSQGEPYAVLQKPFAIGSIYS